MNYLVTSYHYPTGKGEVVGFAASKQNALCLLQDLVTGYIQNADGMERVSLSNPLEKLVLSSLKLGGSPRRVEAAVSAMPAGHYVVVDTREHVNRWTVWQKVEKVKESSFLFGLTSSLQVEHSARKVFDLDLVVLSSPIFKKLFQSSYTKLLLQNGEVDRELLEEARESWKDFTREFEDLELTARLRESEEALKVKAYLEELPTEFELYHRSSTPKKRELLDSPVHMSMFDEIFKFKGKGLEKLFD